MNSRIAIQNTDFEGIDAAQSAQIFGEVIFSMIEKMESENLLPPSEGHSLAGKITGMLLDMRNEGLLALVLQPHALCAKVEEACS